MKNPIFKEWMQSDAENRFGFLILLDQMYGEGKGEAGKGIDILYRSYIGKIKRIKGDKAHGCVNYCVRVS